MNAGDIAYVESLLREYPRRNKVLEFYDLEIKEIELMEGTINGIDYSRDSIKTSNISNPVESLIIRKENLIANLKKQKELKDIHFKKLEIALEEFDDLERDIIKYRYFMRCSWDIVALRVGLNRTSLFEYRKLILDKLINIYSIQDKKISWFSHFFNLKWITWSTK